MASQLGCSVHPCPYPCPHPCLHPRLSLPATEVLPTARSEVEQQLKPGWVFSINHLFYKSVSHLMLICCERFRVQAG